jgi:ubiquinone/menaquinone biosynthesis C-methylase UbiE
VPITDPAPIFELYRGAYATAILTAAVSEFRLFEKLAAGPHTEIEIAGELGISERGANVLIVALRAMKLLANDPAGRVAITDLAREHLAGGAFDISDYVAQAAQTPALREFIARLRTNRPAGAAPQEQGVGWIYREGMRSAMDQEAAARKLTLALAGRARNVAPVTAKRVSLSDAKVLLDVGGGTGIYSFAFLRQNPNLRAIIWDRPQVLKIAGEIAGQEGLSKRVELLPGDMFADPMPPQCDAMLLSNILHDWDIPECQELVGRLAQALPPGGRLMIQDAFLNDTMDGPLNVALFSANLFCVTEGRCYSAAECSRWFNEAGLRIQSLVRTIADCAVLIGVK